MSGGLWSCSGSTVSGRSLRLGLRFCPFCRCCLRAALSLLLEPGSVLKGLGLPGLDVEGLFWCVTLLLWKGGGGGLTPGLRGLAGGLGRPLLQGDPWGLLEGLPSGRSLALGPRTTLGPHAGLALGFPWECSRGDLRLPLGCMVLL